MNWTQKFFNTNYHNLFMNRNPSQIKEEVDIISKLINIKEKNIVDFCCGTADLLAEFHNRNFETYGVDYSQEYVDVANNKHQQKNVFYGNAIDFQFKKQFDNVLNWNSSFGYFDDTNNLKFLKNLFEHTKKDGKVLIEMYNSFFIINKFQETIEYLKEDSKIVRHSIIDFSNRNLIQNWSFATINKEEKFTTTVKLYFIDEIINLMKTVGFSNIKCYNKPLKVSDDLEGATIQSPRIIFIGEKT